jgi:hypothetical protein
MVRKFGTMLGAVALLGGFAGCGGADGEPASDEAGSADDPTVAVSTAAATGCQPTTATVSAHVAAGRAVQQPFFFWQAYYANGTAREFLGLDPNASATLYPAQGGGYTSNAANCATTEPSTCGDGVAQPGEQCDGADLRGMTCADLIVPSPVLPPGTLKCDPGCTAYEVSGCNTKCGDAVIQSGETCEGTNFAGKRCQDYVFLNSFPFNIPVNYAGGQLECNGCQIAVSACKPVPGCYYFPTRGGLTVQCF